MTQAGGSGEQQPVVRVVVDTSVLRQVQGDLGRGDWPALRAAQRLGLLTLHLPTVVLRELVDHRRRDYGSLVRLERDAYKLRARLGELRPNDTAWYLILESQVEDRCRDYSEAVTEWFSAPGSVLAEPAVTHTELVERVLAKRRPFTESERGYRDALIWYSTLEQAALGPTVLLTANTKDFATKGDHGHPLADDLAADLRERAIPPGNVVIHTSTGELMQAVLPAWNDSNVTAAWVSFATSREMVVALDRELDRGLGIQLTAAPPAPSHLWGLGLRSVESVQSAADVRLVAERDGWFRVHSRLDVTGLIGGYVWAWGSPTIDDPEDYVTWDAWGGLTEYHVSRTPRSVSVTVAARFRPTNELDPLEIVDATCDPGGDVDAAHRQNVRRHLEALRSMLRTHANNQAFLDDVLGDGADEFTHIVSGLLRDAASVVGDVSGTYPSLSPDNTHATLSDPSGLQAVTRDLGYVIASMDADRHQQ